MVYLRTPARRERFFLRCHMTPIAESKPFIWKGWEVGTLPILGDHSEKKLELIAEYLVLYLQILLANAHGKPVQEVTFIDGFSG